MSGIEMETLRKLKEAFSACDKLSLETLWDLASVQISLAFVENLDEVSYQSTFENLVAHDSDFWDIFLAAVIIFKSIRANPDLLKEFIMQYGEFLSTDFSVAAETVDDYVQVHSFFVRKLLTQNTNTGISSLLVAIKDGILKTTVVFESTETARVSSLSTQPLLELMSYVLQLATDFDDLRKEIFKDEVGLFGCLVEVILGIVEVDSRSHLAKLLVVPLIQLLVADMQQGQTSEDILLTCWNDLCVPLLTTGDIDTCSIIGFCVVDAARRLGSTVTEGLRIRIGQSSADHSIWSLMLRCLQHRSSLVVRKRGARILQDWTSRDGASETERRSWCRVFLNVYQQLEGCVSMHLVSQVWGDLNRLISHSMSPSPDSDFFSAGDEVPVLSFEWIVVLLRCVLSSQHIPIKKQFLRKILTGKLDIPINHSSIKWVCGELLMTLDNTVYFTTAFSEFPEEVKWKNSGGKCVEIIESDDTSEGEEEKGEGRGEEGGSVINSSSHPGVLLPLFLGRWIIILGERYREDKNCDAKSQMEHLIRAITRTVCGSVEADCNRGDGDAKTASTFKSLSAVKWVLRVFSFDLVRDSLLYQGNPICSIGQAAVVSITSFIKEKFFSMSRIITAHVYAGLVPLLLCTQHNNIENAQLTSPAEVKVGRLRVFMDMLFAIGLHNVLSSQKGWHLLKVSMLDTIAATEDLKNCDQSSLDTFQTLCSQPHHSAYLAVWMGVIGSCKNMPHSDAVAIDIATAKSFSDELLEVAGRMYSSSYTNVDLQWKVIWFLRGMTQFLCSAYNLSGPMEETRAQEDEGSRWVYEDDYSGSGEYFLEKLSLCCNDVMSYLSLVLYSTIVSHRQTPEVSQRLEIPTVDDFHTFCALSCDILTLMFAFPRFPLVEFEGLLNVFVSFIVKISEELCRVNDIVPQNITVPDAFSKLLCLHACGRYLHTLRSLSHTSAISCSALEREKGSLIRNQVAAISDVFRGAFSTHAAKLPSLSLDSLEFQPTSILHDAMHRYHSFGKYYDELYSSRWLTISSALHLLRMCDGCVNGQLFASVASSDVTNLLLQESIEQVCLCSKDPVSHMLNCARLLVDHLYELKKSVPEEGELGGQLEELLYSAWISCTDGDGLCYQNIKLFIQLCFDKRTLRVISPSAQQKLFEGVLELGAKTKPYIIQFVAYRLFRACSEDYTLSFPFFKYYRQLLLYREPLLDDHNLTDSYVDADGSDGAYVRSIYSVLEYSRVTGIDRYTSNQSVRVILLQFLEYSTEVDDPEMKSSIHNLVRDLVKLNREKLFIRQSMVGSEKFGEKLRCWQALCVLAPYVTEALLEEIIDSCLKTLTDPCAHAIRVHMELFLAAMADAYPHMVLPKILTLLRSFNHTLQVLSSYFVVIGYLVNREKMGSKLESWRHQIVCDMMPWLTCAAGLARAIAQYVAYKLIPQVISPEFTTNDIRQKEQCNKDGVEFMWAEIWRFLHENKDAIKLRAKQDSFFTAFSSPERCTVAGLLDIHYDQYGEHVPEHILTILLAAVRSNLLSDEAGDGYSDSLKALPAIMPQPVDGNTSKHSGEDQLQTKITPFDELQLAIESSISSRQRNGVDRDRQDLIVCASLIDKVTNLAGIVRTCEIFAVKEVTLPDINILNNFEFQSISVASAGWMPIREISYEATPTTKTSACRNGELVRYLREMRAQGYQIVGIEQTGASYPLQDTCMINPKCVLVLGKEKEGIPLDILQEVDICIEIPQFGVTRSLNVHVSAALVIWEVTKRALSQQSSPLRA